MVYAVPSCLGMLRDMVLVWKSIRRGRVGVSSEEERRKLVNAGQILASPWHRIITTFVYVHGNTNLVEGVEQILCLHQPPAGERRGEVGRCQPLAPCLAGRYHLHPWRREGRTGG